MSTPSNVFAIPRFGRGMGLGNRLFQWGRCRVFCYKHGLQMIAPIWMRPSLGHLIRNTVNLDQYLHQIALAGLFQTAPGDLSHWHGIWKSRSYPVISEDNIFDHSLRGPPRIEFDKYQYSFLPILGFNYRLLQDLRSMTRHQHLSFIERQPIYSIGLNIRCGRDFIPPPDDTNGYKWVGWLQQTPLSWFVETLTLIRRQLGTSLSAVVVSDGSRAQLAPLLSLPDVVLLRPGNAITDLLTLSRCRLLLASCSSTFSAWAAFLGQMPAITAPGHPLTEWGLESGPEKFIGTFDPMHPDSVFLDYLSEDLLMN